MAITLDVLNKKIGKKNNSPFFAWLADLQRQSGNLDEALKILNKGLENNPNQTDAILVRSAVFYEMENFDAAMEDCQTVLKKNPACLSALKRKGNIFDKQGLEADRNACFRELHDRDPLDSFWKEEYGVIPESEADISENLVLTPEQDESLIMEEPENTEDPFASLSSLIPNEATDDSATINDVAASLNSAMDSLSETPVASDSEMSFGEETMSGEDVSSAISDFFGDEASDDLKNEEEQNALSSVEIPESLEDDSLTEASSGFEKSSATSQQDISRPSTDLESAFNDLLGEEDSLNESSGFEKSSETSQQDMSQPSTNLESAFNDLLGDDDSLNESSGFEKSAETSQQDISQPSTDLESAFNDLLGEDDSLNESPGFEKSAENSVIEDAQESTELPAFAVPPPAMDLGETPEHTLSDLVGEVKTHNADLDLDTIQPEESLESLLNKTTETSRPELSTEENVSAAFDNLFGEDDDLSDDFSDLISPNVQEKETSPDTLKEVENTFSLEDLKDDDEDLTLPTKSLPGNDLEEAQKIVHDLQPRKMEIPNDLEETVSSSLDALFGEDDDELQLPAQTNKADEKVGAFNVLFEEHPKETPLKEEDKVDFLMSGNSDDEIASALLKDPNRSLSENADVLDETLNTKTLAEIYFEQGLYQKSLAIYKDLIQKEPENKQLAARFAEIEKVYKEKFGLED